MSNLALLSEHASPLANLGSEDAGGQNVYVAELSRALARRGLAVDIFTRRDRPDLPEVVDWEPGVRVIHLAAGPVRFLPKDALWPLMPEFRASFLRFARTQPPYALLHGNFWMAGAVAVAAGSILSLPVVQIFHATGKTKRRFQGEADTSPAERIAVEEAVVRGADRLIAQCPAEEAELVGEYGANPARVAVIPSAVNIERFSPVPREEARRRIGLDEAGPVVVYVGRMLPRKDVRNVIEAVARLENVTLLLVGGETAEPDPQRTPEIGVLQALARERGIAHRVCFVGKRQPDELAYYYAAGDVAVTTPWYEPFGLTPLEAMACGRPVIGSAVGGIAFTIRAGETGFLVPPRDPEALAARLRQVLGNDSLRARLGAAARRRVEREFTWDVVAERTARLYESLGCRVPVLTEGRTYGAG